MKRRNKRPTSTQATILHQVANGHYIRRRNGVYYLETSGLDRTKDTVDAQVMAVLMLRGWLTVLRASRPRFVISPKGRRALGV